MQLTYVFSDLATGLKRNISMVVSLILTIAVSLTLFGLGLLINSQVGKIEETLGSRIQVVVQLCNQNSNAPTCVSGEVTDDQQASIEQTIQQSQYVENFNLRSQQEAYDRARDNLDPDDPGEERLFDVVRPTDFKAAYWVTLEEPQDYEKVGSSVQGLPGVDSILDLRDVLNPLYEGLGRLQLAAVGAGVLLLLAAVFQVANTIRLAAFARRRELGIMRLVGASTWYIQLPFMLESLLAAFVGILLAGGGIAVLMLFATELRENFPFLEWVGFQEALTTMGWVALLGVVLAVVPTLLMTRKYLKV